MLNMNINNRHQNSAAHSGAGRKVSRVSSKMSNYSRRSQKESANLRNQMVNGADMGNVVMNFPSGLVTGPPGGRNAGGVGGPMISVQSSQKGGGSQISQRSINQQAGIGIDRAVLDNGGQQIQIQMNFDNMKQYEEGSESGASQRHSNRDQIRFSNSKH